MYILGQWGVLWWQKRQQKLVWITKICRKWTLKRSIFIFSWHNHDFLVKKGRVPPERSLPWLWFTVYLFGAWIFEDNLKTGRESGIHPAHCSEPQVMEYKFLAMLWDLAMTGMIVQTSSRWTMQRPFPFNSFNLCAIQNLHYLFEGTLWFWWHRNIMKNMCFFPIWSQKIIKTDEQKKEKFSQ